MGGGLWSGGLGERPAPKCGNDGNAPAHNGASVSSNGASALRKRSPEANHKLSRGILP